MNAQPKGTHVHKVRHAVDLFLKWREARPLLRVSRSAYAKRLVLYIIEAYEQLRDENDGCDEYEDFLAFLYGLLTDPPPHRTPPRATSPGRLFSTLRLTFCRFFSYLTQDS